MVLARCAHALTRRRLESRQCASDYPIQHKSRHPCFIPALPQQVVHDLYNGGAAVAPVGTAFPGVVVEGGEHCGHWLPLGQVVCSALLCMCHAGRVAA